MLNKISYNQKKIFRFVSSIVLFCVSVLDIAAESYLPDTLLIILKLTGTVFFVVSNFIFIVGQRDNEKVMMDELTRQNEARAAQLFQLLLTIVVSIGIMFTCFTDEKITLSNDVLFCIFIFFSIANDGFYLYLEGKGGKNADFDYED